MEVSLSGAISHSWLSQTGPEVFWPTLRRKRNNFANSAGDVDLDIGTNGKWILPLLPGSQPRTA